MNQLLLYFTISSLACPLLFFIFSPTLSISNEKKNLFYFFSYLPSLISCLISAVFISDSITLNPIFTLSLENTGYFDFSLFLYWKSLLFISVLSFIFLIRAYFLFIEKSDFYNKSASINFYFSGASFFCFSLAILNENYFTEVFFTEIGAFLLYLDQTRKSHEIESLEKVYYFRRYIFVFLTCISILILSFIPAFDIQSLILLTFLLYFLSFVFSKTKIKTYCQASELLIVSLVPIYILDSFMTNGSRAGLELWAPIAILFSTISLYLILSIIAHKNLEIIISRLIPSVLAIYMYLNFSSSGNARQLWALNLINVLLSLGFLLYLRSLYTKVNNKTYRALKLLAWIIALGVVIQIIPGPIMSLDSSTFNIFGVNFIYLILISILITSEIFVWNRSKVSQFDKLQEATDFKPFMFFFLFYIAFILIVFLKYKDFVTSSMLKVDLELYFTSWRFLEIVIAILNGLLLYYWLSKTNFVSRFISKLENDSKEASPVVDARAWDLLNALVFIPQKIQVFIENSNTKFGNKIQSYFELLDEKVLVEFFYKVTRLYLISASGLVRLLHAGNGKIYYLIFSIIVGLFIFFLIGTK